MKKTIALLMLAIFLVSVLSASVSAPITKTHTPSLSVTFGSVASQKTISSFLKAVAQFEGTLKAYSLSQNSYIEEQVFLASDKITTSLNDLNSELTASFKDLSKEQQLTVEYAYLTVGSYLEKLAQEANQIFLDEDGKPKAKFQIIERTSEVPPAFLQGWSPIN